jgi:hypothetical protein
MKSTGYASQGRDPFFLVRYDPKIAPLIAPLFRFAGVLVGHTAISTLVVERLLKMRLKKLNIELTSINKLADVMPLSQAIVEKYRCQINKGQSIEPLQVCFDGQNYWLFDGYHRLQVLSEICSVVIYRGTEDDAYRRYVKDKLRARGLSGMPVFRYCIREIQSRWSHLDNETLARLFGRKPVFFDNVRHLFGTESRDTKPRFSVNKHGTIDLMRVCGQRSGP